MAWYEVAVPQKFWNDVVWSEELGLWNAVTRTNEKIYYSSDGQNWTEGIAPSLGLVYNYNSVVYGRKFDCNPLFVATHKIDPTDADGSVYSTDGMTYTSSNLTYKSRKAVYGDGWFFIYSGDQRVYISDDGINWIRQTDLPLGAGSEIVGLGAYGNGILVAAEEAPNTGIAWSNDLGLTWNTPATAPNIANTALIFDGTNFVLASGDDTEIYYSSNGNTWTQAVSPPQIYKLCHRAGKVYGWKAGLSNVYTSVDSGSTWITVSLPASATWTAVGGKISFVCPTSTTSTSSTSSTSSTTSTTSEPTTSTTSSSPPPEQPPE